MSDPFCFLKPPYTLFDFGLFSLFLAVVYTLLGKVGLRGGGWIYRAGEPRRYWSTVAMYYLGGVLFIVLFLFEVHAF